jgi:hypothetical protein
LGGDGPILRRIPFFAGGQRCLTQYPVQFLNVHHQPETARLAEILWGWAFAHHFLSGRGDDPGAFIFARLLRFPGVRKRCFRFKKRCFLTPKATTN